VRSALIFVVVGLLLAMAVSTGLAFTQEYLDSSFRTPAEVLSELKIPVLASVPLYGSANGNGNGHHGMNGNGNGNGNGVEKIAVPVASDSEIAFDENVDYRQ
jgi:hypothetical protein